MADHYRLYRGDGSPATMDDLASASQNADAIFLGEVHDDPTGHQVELQILERLASPRLALGLEMFERDVQPVINEYLSGFINEENLRTSARAWPNYKTDYRPLMEFAVKQKLPVIASNAPRRYVNRVYRLGSAALSPLPEYAAAWLAPLPYAPASPAYAQKFRQEMAEHMPPSPPPTKGKPAETVAPTMTEADMAHALEAQSLWDATMAFSVADYLTRHPGSSVLHVNGSAHTAEHLGIVEQLGRYRPATHSLVVTICPAALPLHFEMDMKSQGDFVVVTDSSLIKDETKQDNKPHPASASKK